MSEPALKLATDYVRLASLDFSVGWKPSVEADLVKRQLTLTDLANVLRSCEVYWTDKENADDALFQVVGETTDDGTLTVTICINADRRRVIVEEII